MTREQWQQETKRIYKDVSAEEVLESAEKLFNLWDADIGFFDKGLSASQTYGFIDTFFINWRVNVEQINENSVKASVNLETSLPGVIIVGNPPPTSSTPYIYRLFWSRMDYFLGKSDKWFSCKDWVKFNDYNSSEAAQLRGPCSLIVDDKSPIAEQSN